MRQAVGAFLVLSVLATTLLAPALLNDRVLFPRDARTAVPWRYHADAALDAALRDRPTNDTLTDKNVFDHPKLDLAYRLWREEGKVPLWNPYTFGGNPLLATAMPSALYPGNWTFLIDAWRGYTWSALLHFVLSGFFLYLFLRAIGTKPSASLLGGTTYAFSGWMLVHLYLPSYVYAATWFPLMLLATERLLRRPPLGPSTRWFAVLAAAVALSTLAGFPPVTLLSLYATTAYALVRMVRTSREHGLDTGLGRAVACGIAIALGLAAASPQLLPTLELATLSGRSAHTAESLKDGALRPAGLIGLAMPDFFGNPVDQGVTGDRTGPIASRAIGLDGEPPPADWGNNYLENTHYIGLLPLLLALAALVRRPRGATWFWLAIALVGLGLATAVPPFDRIAAHLPGLQTGTLKRCLFLFTAAASILAGLGFDGTVATRGANGGDGPRARLGPAIPFALLAGIGAIAWLSPSLLRGALEWLAGFGDPARVAALTEADWTTWVENTRWCVLRAFAILLPIAAIYALARYGVAARPLRFAVLIVAFVDLAWLGVRFNPTHAPDQTASTPGIAFLEAARADGPFRVARVGPSAHFVLPPDTNLLYGIEDIQGWDVLFPARYQRLMNRIEPGVAEAHHLVGPFRDPASLASPLVAMLGVRFVLTDTDAGESPGTGIRRAYPLAADGTLDGERFAREGLLIYELPAPLPRAWTATDVRHVRDETAALDIVTAPRFDPRTTVVVEGAAPDEFGPTSESAAVEIVGRTSRAFTVRVAAGGPTALVVADAYNPGWRARGPDGELPIRRANSIVRAVALPARDAPMTIEFTYPGTRFQLGVRIAAVAGAILLLVLLFGAFRSARPRVET